MKKLLVIAALCLGAYAIHYFNADVLDQFSPPPVQVSTHDSLIERAYRNRQSNLQVQGVGRVISILPDDNKGRRHQRFIIELASGRTLLIAHNIDLAPRIGALAIGDTVEFYGEYEWNEKGGVIHWTHHDPDGRHKDGWLIHRRKKYS